jgi:riboflavin synthase
VNGACLTRQKTRTLAGMFSGIVEEAGVVNAVVPTPKSIRLKILARKCGRGLPVGGSLAVNGCCLTVVRRAAQGSRVRLEFDLLRETWERTNLQFVEPGSRVNLERSLRMNDRLGGHFVTGHIDGVGRITRWERAGQDHVLDVEAPAEVRKYIVFKGSVAVDGISLTVAGVTRKGFRIWIIPHTFQVTALRDRHVGDAVNLEADLLGKYVQRFITARGPAPARLDAPG